MSALPQPSADLACEGLRMTADEFLALGETEQRLELIDGVVVVSPSPLPLHQKVARLILGQILKIADSGPGLDVYYETDVLLARRTVYCPDIVVYVPGRLAKVPARLDLPPDLAVEVLSPGNRKKDHITKREDYEKYGVGEYWIVEPADVSVVQLVREGDQLVERPSAGDTLVCAAVPSVQVDLSLVRRALR